jgi:YesN/AraC family two-component response regulator
VYKVLLVDDERIIREGIAKVIDWESYGFSLIGAAWNGVEALDIIHRERPEVVITDLKMPVLDGLELIAKVKPELPETVFIILSGYGEFELAREAMRYGVRHYLLKPCNESKISEILDEIREELLRKGQQEKSDIGKSEKLKEVDLVTHNKIVKSIIKYVQDNLSDEQLTLKAIACQVLYMNESYLSKLFIKETGEKFSHYLMRLRMEKAKELIEESDDDRVYEVASKVGFGNNPQYFSQLFKRYTGLAPTEYKKETAIIDQ